MHACKDNSYCMEGNCFLARKPCSIQTFSSPANDILVSITFKLNHFSLLYSVIKLHPLLWKHSVIKESLSLISPFWFLALHGIQLKQIVVQCHLRTLVALKQYGISWHSSAFLKRFSDPCINAGTHGQPECWIHILHQSQAQTPWKRN